MNSIPLNLSEDQIIEYVKCMQSPIYFAANYVWIMENETSTVLPFNMLPYRKKILKILKDGKNLLGHKSRRVGWSWTVATFAAWLINFRPGVNTLFLSYREDEAIELLGKVKFILKNLAFHDAKSYEDATSASWMLGHIEVDNQRTFSIGYHDDDGTVTRVSSVNSLPTTEKTGAGRGSTLIFIDEFGLIKPNDEQVWTAIKPTVARGGQWVACSTPRGVGGVHHRLVMQAQRGENKTYEYMETHWSDTEITPEQYEAAIDGMGEQEIAQEWELSFTQSGDPAFNATHLAAIFKPIEDFPDIQTMLDEYEKLSGVYYSGVDSAMGKAHRSSNLKDYNSWISLTGNGIIAKAYHSKESLAKWAGHTIRNEDVGLDTEVVGTVSKLHKEFPGPCTIEENGPGMTVIGRHHTPNDAVSVVYPITVNQPVKQRLIQNLELAIEGHKITITDLFTYQCLLIYQRGAVPGTWTAPQGYNDDPVMALAMAVDSLRRSNAYAVDFGDPGSVRRVVRTNEEIEKLNYENTGWGPMVSTHPNQFTADPYGNNRFEEIDEDLELILPDLQTMDDLTLNSDKFKPFYDTNKRNEFL